MTAQLDGMNDDQRIPTNRNPGNANRCDPVCPTVADHCVNLPTLGGCALSLTNPVAVTPGIGP